MLIVREVFTAKPGQASKLAKLFKRAMAGMGEIRVMTDLVGNYNTVVMEQPVRDLAEYERKLGEYKTKTIPMDPQVAEEFAHYTELYVTGHREIFQIVE